jgi:hypothetical protein
VRLKLHVFGLFGVFLSGSLLVGCQFSERPGSKSSPALLARDSAGIRIVENLLDEGAFLPVWRPWPVAKLSHGDDPDHPEWFLERVVSGVLLRDSGVAIGDGGLHLVRILDRTGSVRVELLGEGGGPAEVASLGTIQALRGDTLVVEDTGRDRVLFFTSEGSFIQSKQLPAIHPGRPKALCGQLENGTLVSMETTYPDLTPPTGLRRGKLELLLSTWPSYNPVSVLVAPWQEVLVISEGFGASGNRIPLPQNTFLATADNRIFVSDSSSPEVVVLDSIGRMEMKIRWLGGTPPPSGTEVEAAVKKWMASLGPGAESRLSRIFRESMPRTRKLPVHGRILTDALGYLWIKEGPFGDDITGSWLVFGSDGRALARAAIPFGATILDVGAGDIMLLETDSLGVQRVSVYGLDTRGQ